MTKPSPPASASGEVGRREARHAASASPPSDTGCVGKRGGCAVAGGDTLGDDAPLPPLPPRASSPPLPPPPPSSSAAEAASTRATRASSDSGDGESDDDDEAGGDDDAASRHPPRGAKPCPPDGDGEPLLPRGEEGSPSREPGLRCRSKRRRSADARSPLVPASSIVQPPQRAR